MFGWLSKSNNKTDLPNLAKLTATFTMSEVLPTPPLNRVKLIFRTLRSS